MAKKKEEPQITQIPQKAVLSLSPAAAACILRNLPVYYAAGPERPEVERFLDELRKALCR